jgi:hypothetical protein
MGTIMGFILMTIANLIFFLLIYICTYNTCPPIFLRFCEFYQEGNCPTDLLIDFDILNHFDVLILNHDLYIKTAWTPSHLFLIYVNSKELWIETVKVRNISRLVRKMKTKNPRRTCVEFQIQPGHVWCIF